MPERAGRCQQPDGVGADGEEGDEAQVEQAGKAQGDVESEAHQDVDRHQDDDLGEALAECERQYDDQHQQRDQWRCTHHALGLRRQLCVALFDMSTRWPSG